MTEAAALPTGTVTFLFSDIEGSTRLVQKHGEGFRELLETHAHLIRQAIAETEGVEIRTEGDSFFVAFDSAPEAVRAAVLSQKALAAHDWPDGGEVRVRMGMHTGEVTPGGDSYVGIDVHRAARVADSAHGGQIVVSGATAALVEHDLPSEVALRDLGNHSLKDLTHTEHLYQLVIEGLPDEFPRLRTLDAVPNNLPTHLTSFIGRTQELNEGIKLLETSHLLTLTGPGGTGKTRLSLQIAAEVADQFTDGVYFINLASISDPELVPSTVFEAFGDGTGSSKDEPRVALLEYLAEQQPLLILDNFEQLLGAAALVAEILQASPETKLIVTSRAPLRIRGEQELPVPPLVVPDIEHLPSTESLTDYEAVALFVDRAQAVRPDFVLDEGNADAIAELTVRLDGMPLALELAASRVRVFPPQTILDRLDGRMLVSDARDLEPRQRTLYDTIAWSYDLLAGSCQRLFARFSVFVGGAMLEEIEAVCGPADEIGVEIIEGLTELVDHSLIRQPGLGDNPRFRMFTTIREFARTQLEVEDEIAELSGRHAETYLTLAERAEPELTGDDRAEWLNRLGAEHDNLRAALRWAVDQENVDIAERLVASLWRFWQMRGHLFEARERIEEVVALPAGEPRNRSRALEAAGGVAYWQGDFEGARPFYEGALEIERQLGNPGDIANALYNLSFTFLFVGKDEIARSLLEESHEIYQDMGDEAGMARVSWNLGNLALSMDEAQQARDYFTSSVDTLERVGDPFDLGWALYERAESQLRLGEFDAARADLERGLGLFTEANDLSGIVMFLNMFSALERETGNNERAFLLAGATEKFRGESGAELVASEESNVFARIHFETLQSLEGDDKAAFEAGMRFSVEEAIDCALRRD